MKWLIINKTVYITPKNVFLVLIYYLSFVAFFLVPPAWFGALLLFFAHVNSGRWRGKGKKKKRRKKRKRRNWTAESSTSKNIKEGEGGIFSLAGSFFFIQETEQQKKNICTAASLRAVTVKWERNKKEIREKLRPSDLFPEEGNVITAVTKETIERGNSFFFSFRPCLFFYLACKNKKR